MSKVVRTHFFLFVVNVIYALSFTISKDVVPQFIEPFGAILIRVTVGTILFFLTYQFMRARRKKHADTSGLKMEIERKDYFTIVLCGLFGVAINQLLFFKGLSITSPINASLMMTTTPLLVLILSGIFHDERITWWKIAGIILGAAGASIIILSGEGFMLGQGQTMGDIFVLINATSYALYLVIIKPLTRKYSPYAIITWTFFAGWFFVLPAGYSEFTETNWNQFSMQIWFELAFIVVFTTFFAYLLNTLALRHANPSVVGTYIYLQPALATIFAIILQSDKLNLTKAAAMLLIFAGVYLVSLKLSNDEQKGI